MLRKLEHFAEESFGGPRVSFCAEHKVNRLACGINRAVEVIPFPSDFDVGLINAVGVVRRSQVRTNSFLQLRSISLNPPVNRRVIEQEPALPNHFFDVTIAESITQIPAYAEKDDFALVVTPFEWIGFGHGRLLV